MIEDLLTPDEEPAGRSFGNGEIRLASSFSVTARHPEQKSERGTPEGVGNLVFQPVELLARSDWLITCWHPCRTFEGPHKTNENPPGDCDDLYLALSQRWRQGHYGEAGDLGVAVMHELALSYAPAYRALNAWLEDWELSLYLEDELNNHDQLPEIWGLMAVFRDWLNPLNRAGLRTDIDKSWLPATDHAAVVGVDDRIDMALSRLSKLSETLRQSFGLLHLEQVEEQRQQGERMQRRVEIAAAVFLVPTLIVGFYGANTWVPGQGKHWGFWVMVVALLMLSVGAVITVIYMQRRSSAAATSVANERKRIRSEVLRGE